MLAYIIRRLVYLIPVLFVLTVVVFTFVQMLPGDIIDVMMGEEDIEDPEVRAALEEEFGLNDPIYVQYGKWIGRVLQGDLGKSLITRRDVTLELFERIPATAYLAITGMILSMCIAIPLGTLAALNAKPMWTTPFKYWRWPEFSYPNFGSPSWRCCSSCCISAGYRRPDSPVLIYLILPAIAIGFRQAGDTTRLTRSSMLDQMNKEYVDTARSLGFRERKVVYKSRSETR